MNSWYLFYNASLQGSFALANAAAKSKRVRRIWGGLMVYGFLSDMMMANFMSGDEDEDGKLDYDELKDYTLEHSIFIPTFGLTGDKFIKIPLAYGLNMATNLGRSVSRLSRGEYTVGQATSSIVGTIVESLSPVGGFETAYTFISPTVTDPVIQLLENKDYAGRPIVKEGSPFGVPTPDSQRYWTNTSPTAIATAQMINRITGGTEVTPGYFDFSPDTFEFLFEFFTGGLGQFSLRLSEAPNKIVQTLKDDFDGDILREIPIVRKFAISPSQREDVGAFIEVRDEILLAGEELKRAYMSGDAIRIKNVRDKYSGQIKLLNFTKGFNSARNRLVRLKKQIDNNPRIPEKIKEERILKINERLKDIVRRFNARMRAEGYR